MIKRISKIVILLILASLVIIYGWGMLQKLSHNRLVFEADIYAHIPNGNKMVIGFNRAHYFDKQFELDTFSYNIVNSIQNNITFPLIVAKSDSMDEILLARVTKDQEEKIKNIFENKIAPYHSPSVKRYNSVDIYFHRLPNNNFIITAYHKGILAASRDYRQIENFINSSYYNIQQNSSLSESSYIDRMKRNSFVCLFTNYDSTRFALSHTLNDSSALWSGKCFGKLEQKTNKLSNRELETLFFLTHYKVDSVHWEEESEVEIWINKSEK